MPYKIFKTGPISKPYCVYRVNEDGEKFGESFGCHRTQGEAMRQIQAIGARTHSAQGRMSKE